MSCSLPSISGAKAARAWSEICVQNLFFLFPSFLSKNGLKEVYLRDVDAPPSFFTVFLLLENINYLFASKLFSSFLPLKANSNFTFLRNHLRFCTCFIDIICEGLCSSGEKVDGVEDWCFIEPQNPEQNWISIYVMLRRRKIHEFSLGEMFTLARAYTSLNVPCTTANYWNIYLISSLCFMNKAVTVMLCSRLDPHSGLERISFLCSSWKIEFCIRRQIFEIIAFHVNMPYTTAVKYLCVSRLFCISAAFLSCFKASKHSFK